jgi:DNA-binding NarL/FixJ family response regulator
MLAEKNPVINEAYCKLQVMSADEENRMIYEAQRDEYSRIQGARREGLDEGRQEIILQMAEHGMSIKDIATITHVSEQEISGILKAGNA